MLVQNQKEKAELSKQEAVINKQVAVVDAQLKATEKQIRDYQLEKLKKLNKLDVSFFLQLSQVLNLERVEQEDSDSFRFPKNFDKSILFTKNEIQQLSQRELELKWET